MYMHLYKGVQRIHCSEIIFWPAFCWLQDADDIRQEAGDTKQKAVQLREDSDKLAEDVDNAESRLETYEAQAMTDMTLARQVLELGSLLKRLPFNV